MITPFFAYIDPFTGSLILQLLVAGFVAVMIFFQRVKAYVLGLFGITPPKSMEADAVSEDIPTIKLEETNNEGKKAA